MPQVRICEGEPIGNCPACDALVFVRATGVAVCDECEVAYTVQLVVVLTRDDAAQRLWWAANSHEEGT